MNTDRSVPAFSTEELDSIVCGASTLAERLRGDVAPTGQIGQDTALAAARLARWRRVTANREEAVFRSALHAFGSDNLSDEQLLPLLGPVERVPGSALPAWAALLPEMVDAVSAAFADAPDTRKNDDPKMGGTVPFASLYTPIVALARRKVEARAPGQSDRLTERAWRDLGHDLLRRISAICSPILQPKFLAFKAVRRSLTRRSGRPSLFQEFVEKQGKMAFKGVFLEYSVAARQSAQVTLFWINFVAEFLVRLDADTPEISPCFLSGQPLGKLTGIRAGVSDPHHEGRSVLILRLENGRRFVYKPRPLQVSAAFSDLLRWLHVRGLPPRLRPLEVLAREGYGWEEFVECSPCRNRHDAKRFYRRAGALLFLVHALRGIDIHRENLIATADGPVIVDLEALCHPPLPEPRPPADGESAPWPSDTSVFRTGILPLPGWLAARSGSPDQSALGAAIRQRSGGSEVRWTRVNTDEMEAVTGSSSCVCKTHRPRLDGRLLQLRHHADDLADGFARTARFVRSSEAIAREWQAHLARIESLPTRLIARPTCVYTALIERSLQPRYLAAGIDRSIELQALPFTPGDAVQRRAEVTALEVLDVPYFQRMPDGAAGRGGTSSSAVAAGLTVQTAAIRAALAGKKPPARRRKVPRARVD